MQNILKKSTLLVRENNLQLEMSVLKGDREPMVGKLNKYKWSFKITGSSDYNYLKHLEVQFSLDKIGNDYYIINNYKPRKTSYNYESNYNPDGTRVSGSLSYAGPVIGVETTIPNNKKDNDSFSFRHEAVEWHYYDRELNPSQEFEGEADLEFYPSSLGKNFKINISIIPTFLKRRFKLLTTHSVSNPRINLNFLDNECYSIIPCAERISYNPKILIAGFNGTRIDEYKEYIIKGNENYNFEKIDLNLLNNIKLTEVFNPTLSDDIFVLIIEGKEKKMLEKFK